MKMSKKFLPTSILLTKRQRFVLTAVVLSFSLLAIQVANIGWRYLAIGVLATLTFLMGVWSLKEGLNRTKLFTILVLPVFFTAGVGLFYFLLPVNWLARLPVALLFGLGIYALLLTENIFSVAAIRTIQLLRAAHAVGFFLTLVTGFFLFDTILSFRLAPWFNFLLVGVVSLPLLLACLWSVNLEERISRQTWLYSLVLSLILAQIALVISFWPVTVASGSLYLVTTMYILLGLSQLEFSQKLFQASIYEYLGVGAAVLFIMLLTTRWGG